MLKLFLPLLFLTSCHWSWAFLGAEAIDVVEDIVEEETGEKIDINGDGR